MDALWEINYSAKSNMAATGHPYWSYLGNARPMFIILVSIIRFSRDGSPLVRYVVTISNVLTKLHRILLKI